jgi:NAD-dependent DNA ligase
MDMFVRFNRKAIDDRQIDTLMGLCKGLLADGRVNQLEAEYLQNWLAQNSQNTANPVILNLLHKLDAMLGDGVLDAEEAAELFATLQRITGTPGALGEIAKTTSLPLNDPPPDVLFPERTFLFTGTCCFGTRKQCQQATEALGGLAVSGVTLNLDYLVLGTYVTDSWAHETYGRKIEKAMAYRENGAPLKIISEEHWANSGELSSG